MTAAVWHVEEDPLHGAYVTNGEQWFRCSNAPELLARLLNRMDASEAMLRLCENGNYKIRVDGYGQEWWTCLICEGRGDVVDGPFAVRHSASGNCLVGLIRDFLEAPR